MTRRSGGFRGAKPTWTTTSTSGIFGMEDVVDLKAAGQWPRGPVAPTSLAGTGGDQQVALTWVAPATTHGTITDYLVEYTPAAGSPTVVAIGSTAASYTLTGLTNDTEYTIRVAAVNHTRGDWSDSVAVTPSAAAGWDISAATYVRDYSISSHVSNARGIAFSGDGTKFYVADFINNDVTQFNLSSAWSLDGAAHAQQKSVSAQEPGLMDVKFKSDGTKMYVIGNSADAVHEYDLSTAWDISTASYLQAFSVAARENNPRALAFSEDGTKMYVVGQQYRAIIQYNLSAAWNVTTATSASSLSVSAQDTGPVGLFFKPDGTKMYWSGAAEEVVYEYDLSTPWAVSSGTLNQSFSVSGNVSAIYGLAFKPDGLKMFVGDSTNNDLSEYLL